MVGGRGFVVECVISLSGRKGWLGREKDYQSARETHTNHDGAQAMMHPPSEVPPPVSNSTGKPCCSPEVVVWEGAKKEKKESISVGLGGS